MLCILRHIHTTQPNITNKPTDNQPIWSYYGHLWYATPCRPKHRSYVTCLSPQQVDTLPSYLVSKSAASRYMCLSPQQVDTTSITQPQEPPHNPHKHYYIQTHWAHVNCSEKLTWISHGNSSTHWEATRNTRYLQEQYLNRTTQSS